MTPLDLTSLKNAIAQLEDALLCHADTSDPRLALHLRAAVIQAFEYSYELSFKMLKRTLTLIESDPFAIENMTFDEVIRTGYAHGLLQSEISVWRKYRKNRGTTSHTYNEQKAVEVFEAIPAFLADAKYLHEQLEARGDAS